MPPPASPPPFAPASFTTTSVVAVTPAIAETLSAADLASSAAAAAASSSTDAESAVEVVITQTSRVESTLPASVTAAQVQAAIRSNICAAEATCDVAAADTSRRRVLSGAALSRTALSGRSLDDASASFTVTRTLNASSEVSLAAPTVDTAAVAADLGVPATELSATSSLQSVEASITVTSVGSASSESAQSAADAQADLPAALASSLDLDSSAFIFVQLPTVVGPPMPPPFNPPPAVPPPVLPPQPSTTPLPPLPADLPELVDAESGAALTNDGGSKEKSRLRAWHLVVMCVCAVLLLAALSACWRMRVKLCGGRVGIVRAKLSPPPRVEDDDGVLGSKSCQPEQLDLEVAEVSSSASSSRSIEVEPTPSTSELKTHTYV